MIALRSENNVKRSKEWCLTSYIFLFMDFSSISELNKQFESFESLMDRAKKFLNCGYSKSDSCLT